MILYNLNKFLIIYEIFNQMYENPWEFWVRPLSKVSLTLNILNSHVAYSPTLNQVCIAYLVLDKSVQWFKN